MLLKYPQSILVKIIWGSLVVGCLMISEVCHRAVAEPPTRLISPEQLVQQGLERYQAQDYQTAIPLWTQALQQYQRAGDKANSAIVLENLARLHQRIGQMQPALQYWQQAVNLHQQRQDTGETARLMVEQAQAYSQMGQPNQAIKLLCNAPVAKSCQAESAIGLLKNQPSATLAAALGSMGEAYRLNDEMEPAIGLLKRSLEVAQAQNHPRHQITALNSLGNAEISLALRRYQRAESAVQTGDLDIAQTFRQQAQANDRQALDYLNRALQLGQTQNQPQAELRSRLSLLSIHQRLQQPAAAKTQLTQALNQLNQISDSRDRVYAAIDLARLSNDTTRKINCAPNPQLAANSQSKLLLTQAVAIAQRLQDDRAASFALGELGHLYECAGNLPEAIRQTRSARLAAEQDPQSRDSLYLWEWQMGRLLSRQGQRNQAIKLYDRAIATLDSIRGDILTAKQDVQFDFRDRIEAVYREAIALRVEAGKTAPSISNAKAQKGLNLPNPQANSILKTLDTLRLAELQNYFGSECVLTAAQTASTSGEQAQSGTAIFNSVILNDRTLIIVKLPNGETRTAQIPVSRSTLRQAVIDYRKVLERERSPFDTANLRPAQQLYNWLIQPFAEDLKNRGIQTLVFVQDGILRSVPMAALHNGQKFLVQDYAIATTPSLSLTDLRQSDAPPRALVLGLTQAAIVDGQSFAALPYVGQEVEQVSAAIPKSKKLLNQSFTSNQVQQSLKSEAYPILHMATHGQFGNDPEETFLVTGNGQKLTLTNLDRLIRESTKQEGTLDLLALTACETAIGDDRSALGLAGVAVRSGAKSALASLWVVNDQQTASLVQRFYTQLSQNQLSQNQLSKAKALQQAQIQMIESGGDTARPYYWAAFVLIGSWQ